MRDEDRGDWIKRLEVRRDEEIQKMFADYSDSNSIDYSEYLELTTHKIDTDYYLILEMVNKHLDRKRKKKKANATHR